MIQISGFGSDDFKLVTFPLLSSFVCTARRSASTSVRFVDLVWDHVSVILHACHFVSESDAVYRAPLRAKYGRRASSCLFTEICDSRTVHCSCCMPCSTEKRRKNLSNLSTYQAGRRVACLGRFHSACGSISTFRALS